MTEIVGGAPNQNAPAKQPVIEVLGTNIQVVAKGSQVTLDEVIDAASKAKFKQIALYDRDEYLANNGRNCRKLSENNLPYAGSVLVTDVNAAGN